MKTKPQHTFVKALALGVALTLLSHTSPATVVVTIDDFKTAQAVTNGPTGGGPTASTSSITPLSFSQRVLSLSNSEGSTGANSLLQVSTNASNGGPRLALSVDAESSAIMSSTWGTNGLNYNLAGGLSGAPLTSWLTGHALYYDLRSARPPALPMTWTFTDGAGLTSYYNKDLTPTISPSINNPAVAYAMRLVDFTTAAGFDWNSINFLALTATSAADAGPGFTMVNTIRVAEVPEPGTWAAAALLLGVMALVRYRRVRSEQALPDATS
ncbi:MAG: hypothetical protein JHC52_09690 [Chthoniobacterales bacterium]|nr:hypothetical protein [Chthoniobacterales bacterium]